MNQVGLNIISTRFYQVISLGIVSKNVWTTLGFNYTYRRGRKERLLFMSPIDIIVAASSEEMDNSLVTW